MRILLPIPDLDVDPSEVAVSWRVLSEAGFQVVFATPSGQPGTADAVMLTGQGLDPWGQIPALRRFVLLGRLLRADAAAREAHRRLLLDASWQAPLGYAELQAAGFDALLLPGGHRARGMRAYLESSVLKRLVGDFFASGKPVAAICHGVLLAARSRSQATGRSVLYGRKTTALPWAMEQTAWHLTRWFGRFWDPNYYRTYLEEPGAPAGSLSVEAEVKEALAAPSDFVDVAPGLATWLTKASGMFRDGPLRRWPAHVVVDGNYVSARWPGDVHTFAATFAELIKKTSKHHAPAHSAGVEASVQPGPAPGAAL